MTQCIHPVTNALGRDDWAFSTGLHFAEPSPGCTPDPVRSGLGGPGRTGFGTGLDCVAGSLLQRLLHLCRLHGAVRPLLTAAMSPHDRPPRIRYDCFLPSLAAFTWGRFDPFRASLSIASSHRALRLFTRFSPALRAAQVCPSSPGFDLRLPLHVRSRSRSCHRLTVRRVNVRRGLAPPSYRPCRAYNKKPPAQHRRF